MPPKEYLEAAARAVGAQGRSDSTYTCSHDPESIDHIRFEWAGSDAVILLCDQCAIKSKNALGKLADGIAVPDVLNSISVSIVRPLEPVSGDDGCRDILTRPVSRDLLEEYSSGKIGDRDLIEKHMEEVKRELATTDEKALVMGNRCFGSDVEAFVGELTGDPVEADAVRGMLAGIGHPVVVAAGDTVSKLLSTYWTDHGKAALKGVVSDKLAEQFYDDGEEAIRSPLKIIRRAAKRAEQDAVSSRIPRYNDLGTYGAFVDKVARRYKTGGASAATAVLDVHSSADHRIRSVAYAFDLALGITSREWRFTNEEKEYGKHLKIFASRLLDSEDPDTHHLAFVTFLKEAGVTEEVNRV